MELNRTNGWWLDDRCVGPSRILSGRVVRPSHVCLDGNPVCVHTNTRWTENLFAATHWAVVFTLADPNEHNRTKSVGRLELPLRMPSQSPICTRRPKCLSMSSSLGGAGDYHGNSMAYLHDGFPTVACGFAGCALVASMVGGYKTVVVHSQGMTIIYNFFFSEHVLTK